MPKSDLFEEDENEKSPPVKIEESDEDQTPAEEVSTEPDANDDDDGKQAGDGEWAKKRRNRFKEAQAAAEAAKQRADELDRQLQEERATRAAAQEVARQSIAYQQASQQQRDPWAEAFKQVDDKRRAIIAEAENLTNRNAYTPEERQRLLREWNETERSQQALVAQQQLQQYEYYRQQTTPNLAQNAQVAAAESAIRMRYPDIMANPQAQAYMSQTFLRAVQTLGKKNDFSTADEVAAETRRVFRMSPPPPADAATRARYSGVGGGGGSGSGGNGPVTVPKTKAFMKMAVSRYGALAREKGADAAFKKWAQNEGKAMMQEGDD